MLKFKYKIANSTKEGNIFADNKQQALMMLSRNGITVSSIISEKKHIEKNKKYDKSLNSSIALPFLKRILQLHGAGLPIGDTLKILQARLRDSNQQELAAGLWRELSEGKSFGDALKLYPKIFGDEIVFAIQATEITGNLAPVLSELIQLLEERQKLKKKILSGMAYPAFVTVVALLVVGFFLFFLLPRIESMLTALGGKLTLPARILVGVSGIMLYGLPIALVFSIISWFSINYWIKHSKFAKFKIDNFLLHIPVINTLIRYVEICRVSNLLSTLLSSGVNLTEAMRLTERTIHNTCLKQIYQEARSKINDGVALSVAFKIKKIPFFTDLALDILTVGESTGNMQDSLKEVYRLHNKDLDGKLRFITAFVTSGALGFAFFMVGVLALGIVTSIMQFGSSLKM